MKRQELPLLAGLVAFGVFVWRHAHASGESLPLLLGLPLYFVLGAPWTRRPAPRQPLRPGPALFGATLFAGGTLLDSDLLLAAAWTAFFWGWVSAVFVEAPGACLRRLLVLPLFSFPWLTSDFERLAWWFRLSGAAATESLLHLAGAPIVREGTFLWSGNLALSVEPACSGVNGLQTMLVAGSALLYLKLRHSPLFWWNLPVLAAAAWLANLLRILAAALCGWLLDGATAQHWVGPIHAVAGWAALVAAFALCYGCFSAQAWAAARWPARARRRAWPLLPHLALLAYGLYAARSLAGSWRWAPYDRLAWLAFLVWLVPLVLPTGARAAAPGRAGLLLAACVMFLFAAAADLNAAQHLGFALVLASFNRGRGWMPWLAGAAAWLPAAGWVGSRLGVDPSTFAVGRVSLAAVAVALGVTFGGRRPRPVYRAAPAASPAALLPRGVNHAD